MTGELLDGEDIDPGVEEVGDCRPSEVVGRESVGARFFLPAAEDVGDGLAAKLGLTSLESSAVDQLASVAYRAGESEKAEQLYEEAARLSEAVGRGANAAISRVNAALAASDGVPQLRARRSAGGAASAARGGRGRGGRG